MRVWAASDPQFSRRPLGNKKRAEPEPHPACKRARVKIRVNEIAFDQGRRRQDLRTLGASGWRRWTEMRAWRETISGSVYCRWVHRPPQTLPYGTKIGAGFLTRPQPQSNRRACRHAGIPPWLGRPSSSWAKGRGQRVERGSWGRCGPRQISNPLRVHDALSLPLPQAGRTHKRISGGTRTDRRDT
jgi:hypothetical protein